MEIYLQYRKLEITKKSFTEKIDEKLIISSVQQKIDNLIVELESHSLKNLGNNYNSINIDPKKNVEFEIKLKIYGEQEDISKYIDIFDDFQQIQDYNEENLYLKISPTELDKKEIKYDQLIPVYLTKIDVTNNIYNNKKCREITLNFLSKESLVYIRFNDDYYIKYNKI